MILKEVFQLLVPNGNFLLNVIPKMGIVFSPYG